MNEGQRPLLDGGHLVHAAVLYALRVLHVNYVLAGVVLVVVLRAQHVEVGPVGFVDVRVDVVQ